MRACSNTAGLLFVRSNRATRPPCWRVAMTSGGGGSVPATSTPARPPASWSNIGYSVFPAHRSKGYASEALRLLVHRLRADGRLRSATMEVDAQNLASLRVAEKVGFEEVARTAGSVRFGMRLR